MVPRPSATLCRFAMSATLGRKHDSSGRRRESSVQGTVMNAPRSPPLPVGSAGATCRDFGFVADDRWAQLPPGCNWSEVPAVATDSRDRVFVFCR